MVYEFKAILSIGLYAVPVAIGGLFFEKEPLFMSFIMIFGCILLGVKLSSDLDTAKARRSYCGLGDLSRGN